MRRQVSPAAPSRERDPPEPPSGRSQWEAETRPAVPSSHKASFAPAHGAPDLGACDALEPPPPLTQPLKAACGAATSGPVELQKDWDAREAMSASASETSEDIRVDIISRRWSNLVLDMLTVREQHVLREIWDNQDLKDGGSPTFAKQQRSTSSLEAAGDVVRRSWLSMRVTAKFAKSSSSVNREHRHARVNPLNRFVLHPYSWKRMAWTLLGLSFMGFDILWATMEQFSFIDPEARALVELAASSYWTADICLSFVTGFFVHTHLQVDLRAIARRYLTSWFLFDITLVIVQWMTLLRGDPATNRAMVARYIRSARYARLLRFVKLEQLLSGVLERINSVPLTLACRIALYLVGIALWVHVSGCVWHALGMSSQEGWVMTREPMDFPVNYFVAVQWAGSQLQGNTDIYAVVRANERAFVIVHTLVSVVVLSTFVSKLTTVMQALEEINVKMNRQASGAQQYCVQHGISMPLSVRVRKWIEWHQMLDAKRQRSVQEDEFMHLLPTDLRRALLDEARSPLLVQHAVFHGCRECNPRFFERLACDTFIPVTYMPEDTVFSFGMSCTRMLVIASGKSTYFKYGMILRMLMQNGQAVRGATTATNMKEKYKRMRSEFLREGACLCEAVLWVHWVHLGDFDAVSHLSLLTLEAHRFAELVASYPSVLRALQRHAQIFLCSMRAANDPADRFNTDIALQQLV